jgi:hypothetical protein
MQTNYLRHGLKKLLSVFLLISLAVTMPPGMSSAAAANPPLVGDSTSGTQTSFILHGQVKDPSGNPLPADIYVTNRQNAVVVDLSTGADGSYSVSIPSRDDIVVMATPLGNPQTLITLPDNFQTSRYLPITKGVQPDGDSVELSFTIPTAAALQLDAYSPAGSLLNYNQLYNAVNPPGFYGDDDIYGAFPLSGMDLPVPTEASIGMLRWAWPPNNDSNLWQPCFWVPSDEAVFIMMLWEVPGIGTFPLRADHQGQGYNLSNGANLKINLVYEFAETEYRRAVELKTNLEGQGNSFTSGLADLLNQAKTLLIQARGEGSESSQSALSYDVLKLSIQAKEQMTMEAAGENIPKRKTETKIVVQDTAGHPVPEATVAYQQSKLNFVLTYGQFGQAMPFQDPSYRAGLDIGFQSLYGIVAWNQVSPQEGVFDFSAIDAAFNEWRSVGYEITATLAWLGSDNVPTWAQNLSFAEFQQQMGLFVRRAVEHFNGVVKYMNVATEINLQTTAGSRYISVAYPSNYGTGVHQDELIELIKTAFQSARDAHSSILLGYYPISDYIYRSLNPLPTGAWPLTYSFVKAVMESGVQPDFIGVEMFPQTGNVPIDLSTVAGILQTYHDLTGLPVLVVETISAPTRAEDYGDAGPAPNVYWHAGMTQADQAEWDTSFYKIAMSLPYVLGVQMFHNFPDYLPSITEVTAYVKLGTDTLNSHYQPKQVYSAMQNLIASWKTSGSALTGADGAISLIGLGGTYTLTVTAANGLVQSFERQLNPQTQVVTLIFDSSQALMNLQQRLSKAQKSVNWSAQLGRTLDYPVLRSQITQARSAITVGSYASANNLVNQVLDATALHIDGSAADWLGIAPLMTTAPGGVLTNAAGIDLKAVYGMMDDEYLYLRIEVYDPPIVLQPEALNDGTWWEPQFLFNLDNGAGEQYHIRTYLPYRGEINLYNLTEPSSFIGLYYSIAYQDTLEIKVPLALISSPNRLSVSAFVMANVNGEEKPAKWFDGWADVLFPKPTIYLPTIKK